MQASPHLPAWVNGIMLALGGGGVGAVIVALVRKPWTLTEQASLNAKAGRERAAGEADVLTAMASTFTDVTGGLREEIERLYSEASEMRQRAVQFEIELRAALKRVSDLEQLLEQKDATIARLQADLDRVRAERDAANERVVQQEGEIRQLNALLESKKRTSP